MNVGNRKKYEKKQTISLMGGKKGVSINIHLWTMWARFCLINPWSDMILYLMDCRSECFVHFPAYIYWYFIFLEMPKTLNSYWFMLVEVFQQHTTLRIRFISSPFLNSWTNLSWSIRQIISPVKRITIFKSFILLELDRGKHIFLCISTYLVQQIQSASSLVESTHTARKLSTSCSDVLSALGKATSTFLLFVISISFFND